MDIKASLIGVDLSSVAWGDYDNDGDLDILLTGRSISGPVAKIYDNSNGTFNEIAASLVGVEMSSVAWGDYDKDRDLDIILTGYTGNESIAKIYRNNSNISNSAPTIPPLLQSMTFANSVELSWPKSTDQQTVQDALTYNIRIGTMPGGCEIMSPMADITNGYRRIAALGNTNHNTSWTIRNLPQGTYYWSVQAIDNAFAGSPFNAEQIFTIDGTVETVNPPTALIIPSIGKKEQTINFSASGSSCSQGHPVEYQFEWGDGTPPTWGTSIQSHTYHNIGTKNIKARARCKINTTVVSDWSQAYQIIISYCKLTLIITPPGSGSVQKNPDKPGYDYNETVQLTAYANPTYQFDHWEGDTTGTGRQVSITMSGDKNVKAIFRSQQDDPVHFSFTKTDESYSIVVEAATLNGENLQPGDEIGVFTPTGLCVGASVWTGQTPLGLVAWKDDPQTPNIVDGYRDGETMYFFIWNASSGSAEHYQATPTYTTGNGTFGYGVFSQISILAAMTYSTQTMALNKGWSWISFNVQPADPNVEHIFVNTKYLQILINGLGKFYIPGVINDIGNWNVLEGYKINVAADDNVMVKGQQQPFNTSISLKKGWNFVAYLPQVNIPVDKALQSIMSVLEIVKNDEGDFFIPNVINTLGTMEVGEGYKMHLTNPATLGYPNSAVLAKNFNIYQGTILDSLDHFIFKSGTSESYSIVIDDAMIAEQSLEIGDEIGVLNSDSLCVGATVWTGQVPLGLAAWADDPQTSEIDGYKPGDAMHFAIWDSSADREYAAKAVYSFGDSIFVSNIFCRISLLNAIVPSTSLNDFSREIQQEFFILQNFPNPFNPETTIDYHLPISCHVILSIYNTIGQEIKTLINGEQQSGYHQIIWDGKDNSGKKVGTGIYLYQLQADGFVAVKKMIMIQ